MFCSYNLSIQLRTIVFNHEVRTQTGIQHWRRGYIEPEKQEFEVKINILERKKFNLIYKHFDPHPLVLNHGRIFIYGQV